MRKIVTVVFILFATFVGAQNEIGPIHKNGHDLYFQDDPEGSDSAFIYNHGANKYYGGTIIIPDTFTFNNKLYRVYGIQSGAFYTCEVDSVFIPNSVVEIRDWAFWGIQTMTSITLPNRLDSIGEHAFENSLIENVYCMSPIPPRLADSIFDGSVLNRKLYVPNGSVQAYTESDWGTRGYFASINGAFLGNTNVDTVTSNSVTIRWVNEPAAVNYTISIYTADTLYRQYYIDNEGNLHRLKLPAIPHARMDTATSSTDFCVLTIDNMASGTDYMYIVEGNDVNNAPVYNETGVFRTEEEEEGIEDIPVNGERTNGRKVIRDGQVLILRDDRWITIQGQTIQP